MLKPVIGVTCHLQAGQLPRSAAVQMYIDAVEAAGGAAALLPLGVSTESTRAVYRLLDGILLPGGDDVAPHRYRRERHPLLGSVDDRRDELEIVVAEWALADDLPILGICRGIQVLAVAAGGSLYQDIPSEWESGLAHDVREFGRDHLSHGMQVEARSRLATAIGCTTSRVNSFHHQSVRDVPEGFVVSARSEDGIVEGIEGVSHGFAVGVQCHPEGMWQTTAPHFAGLFSAFIAAASEKAGTR